MEKERWFVYVLLCGEGRRYIGLSGNPDARLDAHNKGLSFWTSRYHNWKRVYLREFSCYREARKWELHLKKQKGGSGLKKLLSSPGS